MFRNIIKRRDLYSIFCELRYKSLKQGSQKKSHKIENSRNLTYAYNADGTVSDTSDKPKRRRKKVVKKPIQSDLDDVKINFKGLEPQQRWSEPLEKEKLIRELPHPICDGILDKAISKILEVQEEVDRFLEKLYDEKNNNSILMLDYIEFRTFEIPEMGIKHIASIFEDFGYTGDNKTYKIPGRYMEYKWLSPKSNVALPRIVISSIKLDVLKKQNQEVIKRCLGDWLKLSKRYLPAAFGMVKPPWSAPTLAEYENLYNDSDFAAWVLVNGYTISCLGLSVHGMINPVYKFGKIPQNIVTLEKVVEITDKDGAFFWNPIGKDVIKEFENGNIRICATVAELVGFFFADGKMIDIPRSHIACIERKLLPKFKDLPEKSDFHGFREEHYYDGITPEMMATMHISTEAAMPIAIETIKLNEEVRERAKKDGKVLNMESSNEEDLELYKKYFNEAMKEKIKAFKISQKPRVYNKNVTKEYDEFDGTEIDIPGVVTAEDIPKFKD